MILDCKPMKKQTQNKCCNDYSEHNDRYDDEDTHVFETEIIDSGIGISEERQNMLFIPFLELKMRQNLKQVQDNNIGMGLGCSQQIVTQLGGDITVKQSKRGLTIFGFRIPVRIQQFQQKEQSDDKSNISFNTSQDLSNVGFNSNHILINQTNTLEV